LSLLYFFVPRPLRAPISRTGSALLAAEANPHRDPRRVITWAQLKMVGTAGHARVRQPSFASLQPAKLVYIFGSNLSVCVTTLGACLNPRGRRRSGTEPANQATAAPSATGKQRIGKQQITLTQQWAPAH
jgi:hypothetical protein